MKQAAERHPFVVYLGRLDGTSKALALAAADAMLMPGLVGLAVLDAFAAGLPVITTDVDYHSPEIEYLVHEENGLLLPAEISSDGYGRVVSEVLREETRHERLRTGSLKAAQRYTNEAMVDNFTVGVLAALDRR